MRASALAAWPRWIGTFEGVRLSDGTLFQWLGLDSRRRPVTAYGCDLASPGAMAALTWRHGPGADAPIASYQEITAEWTRVAMMVAHAGQGAASKAFRESAQLYYDVQSMNAWINAKIRVLEAILKKHIPTWAICPAVVQLARMRTEWAVGDEAWPKLDLAIGRGEWVTAAKECWPSDAGPDPEDPKTADRRLTQPREYVQSYTAVRALYRLADAYPGDELPDPLPDGTSPCDTDPAPPASVA